MVPSKTGVMEMPSDFNPEPQPVVVLRTVVSPPTILNHCPVSTI